MKRVNSLFQECVIALASKNMHENSQHSFPQSIYFVRKALSLTVMTYFVMCLARLSSSIHSVYSNSVMFYRSLSLAIPRVVLAHVDISVLGISCQIMVLIEVIIECDGYIIDQPISDYEKRQSEIRRLCTAVPILGKSRLSR